MTSLPTRGVARQIDASLVLREHRERIRALEANLVNSKDGAWIYVGTVGFDGVDLLITLDSPPFQNSWTNSLGPDAPVSFVRTASGWVKMRGGFYGGVDGSVVFTLPVGYRPAFRQQMVIPTGTPNHYATAVVGTSGDVVFGTVV